MAKAIVARRKGDEYQAKVFWLEVLKLRTDDHVESVTMESDQVSFVDDVVVSYCEPIMEKSTSKRVVRDLFQCKYHMTQRDTFNHENLINPAFIKSKKSMLQRLYDAYVILSDELNPDEFRLYIFSNWNWDSQDVVRDHLHEEMLRSTFYETGPRSGVGQVRLKWAEHLSISETELRAFLDTVRFNLEKNLTDLEREMKLRLKLAGMQPIDPTVTYNVYDDLAWKFLGQGRNSFDRDSFDQMIRKKS